MFPPLRYHGQIRPMLLGDLPAVLSIEQASFARPWTEAGFVEVLRRAKVCRAYVFEPEHEILGYFVFEQRGFCVHLMNLAVHPQHRGHGHATSMLKELEEVVAAHFTARLGATPSGCPSSGVVGRIVLEVQESNLPAQLLYRSLGYRAVRILRRHYRELGEDGYRMVKRLHTVPVESVIP